MKQGYWRTSGHENPIRSGYASTAATALVRHNVSTAFEMAWAELDNGALLKAAEDQFDVLITTDRKLRFQQNLTARQLAILVLPATSWPEIQRHEVEIATTVDRMQAGDFVEMDFA